MAQDLPTHPRLVLLPQRWLGLLVLQEVAFTILINPQQLSLLLIVPERYLLRGPILGPTRMEMDLPHLQLLSLLSLRRHLNITTSRNLKEDLALEVRANLPRAKLKWTALLAPSAWNLSLIVYRERGLTSCRCVDMLFTTLASLPFMVLQRLSESLRRKVDTEISRVLLGCVGSAGELSFSAIAKEGDTTVSRP